LLETHIFDFKGDIYGKRLEVQLVAYLRPEKRFESLDLMVRQMHLDAAEARVILATPG
jgi:riboflavin kinase/FMN adenylyltransferase